jgi:hypothetical protein
MNSSDIDLLLSRISENAEEVPAEVREVFSMLVKTTLDFRDRYLKEHGITVTVEDVKAALDWLLFFLKSGHHPKTNHLIRRELFETWIREIEEVRSCKCLKL